MRRVCLILLALAFLLTAGDARAITPTEAAAYNAVAPEVASCPADRGGVVPILVDGLIDGRALGQVGPAWGPCAFAIDSRQDAYSGCVAIFHEREHLRQFDQTGRIWHVPGTYMDESYDPSRYFAPCATLVPPTLDPADAKRAVIDLHRNIWTLKCKRRDAAAVRCYGRTANGKRRMFDVWRNQRRVIQMQQMGKRRHSPLTQHAK